MVARTTKIPCVDTVVIIKSVNVIRGCDEGQRGATRGSEGMRGLVRPREVVGLARGCKASRGGRVITSTHYCTCIRILYIHHMHVCVC